MRVTSSTGPTGRHPWDTTTSTRSAPLNASPTPPSCAIQSLSSSALVPGRFPALAMPPTTRSPDAWRLNAPRQRSTSNVNGSASTTTSSAPSVFGVQRANSAGSSRAAVHAALTITNGLSSTPGSDAASTVNAGLVSISCLEVMTPWALVPMRQPGFSMSRSVWARSATPARCASSKKHMTRSAAAPFRSRAIVSATARAALGESDRSLKADVQRIEGAVCVELMSVSRNACARLSRRS